MLEFLCYVIPQSIMVTGNANYKMSNNSFTMMGFTQPFSAIPIIKDTSNNVKGFTSRILWFFPQPICAKLRETTLTTEEIQMDTEFEEFFGLFSRGKAHILRLSVPLQFLMDVVPKVFGNDIKNDSEELETTPNDPQPIPSTSERWHLKKDCLIKSESIMEKSFILLCTLRSALPTSEAMQRETHIAKLSHK
ncbi:hypothetical protein QZH41_016900 [Actinostola sp. cb2023]|nr:hypothetical protein QZH41_016900 [Actinostola sp. cb2023]